ncbi:hypothetical protein [Candidatus Nitrosotalea sp. TS]|uniref:hypothetical protein n=1 Tax=Candidatus Nitrosotalea sp. TS TaxID=2341020 RepID=UPI0014084006|nr:hypothetical protein [Candidatus Nitrosotalea sp. TS]
MRVSDDGFEVLAVDEFEILASDDFEMLTPSGLPMVFASEGCLGVSIRDGSEILTSSVRCEVLTLDCFDMLTSDGFGTCTSRDFLSALVPDSFL